MIRRRERLESRRTLPFFLADHDGEALPNRQITPRICQNGSHWTPSKAAILDLGDGHYSMTLPRDEIDFVGSLAVSVATVGRDGSHVSLGFGATITPNTEPEDPPVYFTTTPPPRSTLEVMGEQWGISRRPGETDEQLRARIRNRLYTGNSRGTLEDIHRAVMSCEGVQRCDVGETPLHPGHVSIVVWGGDINEVDAALVEALPVGIGRSIEMREPE